MNYEREWKLYGLYLAFLTGMGLVVMGVYFYSVVSHECECPPAIEQGP